MNDTLVLALDIGTSSTRALLFDTNGRKFGETAQIEYAQDTTPDGGVETDAEKLFELTTQCIDQALLVAGKHPVVAVAASCFWHSLLATDDAGKALTQVYSWADNRSAPWIPAVRALLDETATHARTGCVVHTSYWPAKLLWLQGTQPHLFQSGTRWLGFGEYLAWRLFGAAKASLSMASGTGLFNQNECDWDEATLRLLPVTREQLPNLIDANDSLGTLQPAWSERWPQLRDVPWYPALGDGACSNVGSGCVSPQHVALNVGTSGALRVVLSAAEHPEPAPHGLWRYRLDRKRVLVGGALSNGGNVWAWCERNLRLDDVVEGQLAAVEPDSTGLTVLPFLAGERAPLWNGEARLVIEGASLDTSPLHIARACLEASSLRFAAVLHRLREAFGGDAATRELQVVASGGALARSAVWAQIMADCLGVPLVHSLEAEASARGAALMALEACGLIENINQLPIDSGEIIQPNPDHHVIYTRALERQETLYQKLYGSAKA